MTNIEIRIPENAHLPLSCPINGLDCEGCATWQNGRRLGYLEAALAVQHWDADEEGCAVCFAVQAIEAHYGIAFPPGLPSAGPEARFEVAMMVHLGGIKQLGGGAPKRRLQVRADLRRPKRRLIPKPIKPLVRRRPAAQLEVLPLCRDCGLPFEAGSAPGQDQYCLVDWSNRQPQVRPRRRGMGIPPAALMRRGAFAADHVDRGPVERVKRWGRRVFR